ncbi:MAG: mannose-1-phosphate guanylyltransferase/mannose-6-phosphate isomerase [Xanthomonadaceae bacterium]|nr:mannose-1-phosphate guanylyltransferase/mannose-6-phosphate isomerase [Xanthomonadaceae bacterium]
MLVPVILSGGSGTRLWPLSRKHYPKQFIPLTGEHSLFQNTLERIAPLRQQGPLVVVCNHEHRFMVAEQLQACGEREARSLLEPVARNTAPAVAVGALEALKEVPDAVLLVLPADHVIRDREAFLAAVELGREAALGGSLVTFGVAPTRPEAGYGYIKAAQVEGAVRPVERFVEKPDLQTAQEYVDSGQYFWNSGVFMFRADRFLEELAALEPDMLAACRAASERASRDLDFIRLDAEAFAASPSSSVDYAVMERTRHAVVVPLEAGWSDVGSWDALQEVGPADEHGNVVLGDVVCADSSDCYIRSESRLVAVLGVRNQVVIETPDAVLVADRSRAQEIKALVERLQREGRGECEAHRRVLRPWGSYEGIASADRFQVKRIVVRPGARLSLQMHHHRAEHWIVVRGTARVHKGEESFLLSEDQSAYIPLGTVHRLENPGVIPLELIEVQTGSYLGEDDILRFDDSYGRA